MRMVSCLTAVFATALLTAGAAAAPRPSDDLLARRIEERLAGAGLERAGDVSVSVSGGAATLEGFVTNLEASRRAELLARHETRRVTNRLRVAVSVRPDAEIAADVRREILRYPNATLFDDFAFSVEQGRVTLLGSVQQPYRRSDVEQRVARLAGVRAIDNRIEVQPVSGFDDGIRAALARAIYGGGRFIYTAGVNPPVRILVRNGRVTLSGVVVSRVDRVAMLMLAREVAPFGVTDRLQIESELGREPAPAARPSGDTTLS